jgi:D-glycero-alpha-D-manno-heptose-7-phosphate kinase
MIIARSPLRISLGGGGTDLPSYYREHGGFLIAAAIDKAVYVTVHRTFLPEMVVRYSQIERVSGPRQVRHPIVREALDLLSVEQQNLEITSMADIPAGTGLGSSGSFGTALLKGGVNCYEFHPDDTVTVTPLSISDDTLDEFQLRVLMFSTNITRQAGDILGDQNNRTIKKSGDMIANLHSIKQIGYESRAVLESGKLDEFGKLMHEHWERKRARSVMISNPQIDYWYEVARKNGAVGGKLIGAGGGGFLMFLAEEPRKLRKAMEAQGLGELRFQFDYQGTRILQ